MSYRKEASTRVLYFSVAFLASCGTAVIAGIAAALVTSGLHLSIAAQANVFASSAVIAFAITCAVTVYKADQILSKKYHKNP